MTNRSTRRLLLLSTPLLAIVVLAVTHAQRRPAPRAETPFERLGRVTAWDVNFHMEYQHTNDDGTVDRGVSDWIGTLDHTDWSSESYRGWYGDLSVRVQGKCSGTEKRGDLGFRFYAQGYYELSLGYANLDCTTYSESWKIKRPLPDQTNIVSGSDKLDLTAGPPCAHNCGPNSIALTWNFSPAGTKPPLQAVPNVAPTLMRGETLTLDGSKSTGKIVDYKWTFKLSGTSASEPPDANAEKHGAQSTVVLLDSMNITLEVSDGQKVNKKTVSVLVTPRKDFRTTFETAAEEGTLPDSDRPICRVTGTAANGAKEYAGGWVGGENACAFDPPRSKSEPAHIFHPNPENSAKDEQYTSTKVNDPGGPWDGFSYFDSWKLKIKRATLLNKYILPGGPPVFAAMTKNFYQMNVEMGNDVAGYLQAVRQHEKQHSDLMQQALAASDPARDTEKAYGKDEAKLRREVDDRIREATKRLHDRAKDPLAEIWHGNLAVPQDDTYEWRTFLQHVGGSYTIDF